MKKFSITTLILISFVIFLQAQITHHIGEKYEGGIIFSLSRDSLHGLIAEIIDQGECNYFSAANIAQIGKHSTEGKRYRDWRLPNQLELEKLYRNRETIGGFTNNLYWSSSLKSAQSPMYGDVYCQSFSANGYDREKGNVASYNDYNVVRAVREF